MPSTPRTLDNLKGALEDAMQEYCDEVTQTWSLEGNPLNNPVTDVVEEALQGRFRKLEGLKGALAHIHSLAREVAQASAARISVGDRVFWTPAGAATEIGGEVLYVPDARCPLFIVMDDNGRVWSLRQQALHPFNTGHTNGGCP